MGQSVQEWTSFSTTLFKLQRIWDKVFKNGPVLVQHCLNCNAYGTKYSRMDQVKCSVRNSLPQSANAEVFADAYLCFLVSASAKKIPRQLNS